MKTLQGRGRDSQSQPISGVRGEGKGNPNWGKKINLKGWKASISNNVVRAKLRSLCLSKNEIQVRRFLEGMKGK